MSGSDGIVVDVDGHVLEPRDTWLRYIDPQFRDRAIRIAEDDKGWEMLLIDGKSHPVVHGIMGAIGGVGMEEDVSALFTPGARKYEDGFVPGGVDPAARIEQLDSEGIDIAMLYPTLGILWEGMVSDPRLADAYTRAYNRYIVDFCSHNRKRLVPVAHIALLDINLAVAEVKRAREAGCVGIYISPDPPSRGGRQLDDPALDPFYRIAAELDMPIAFHVVVHQKDLLADYDSGPGATNTAFKGCFLALEVMAAFTQLLLSGVLERHPRLRVAVLETGSNWLGAWLDRMDHKWEKLMVGREAVLKMKPSEYFHRQCIISADPDETMTDVMVERFGDDKVVWASDYPHIDAEENVLPELRRSLARLPIESQRNVLGNNAVRFYGLST
jgi:uncharacterized protein